MSIQNNLKLNKYFLRALPVLVIMLSFNLHAMKRKAEDQAEGESPNKKAHIDDSGALLRFVEMREIIHGHLKDIKESELHFFWTTGRTLSNDPTFEPDLKVNVGGPLYAEKFFIYVDKLLENSPDNLKIKFVCDTLTASSNQEQIEELQSKFSNRFEIIPIENVIENLISAFPTFEENIKQIFRHATQGNPVIASDIYRVIGMVYGHNQLSNITDRQFSYSDIDLFCSGMENVNYFKHLTNDLFSVKLEEPFYMATKNNNNDLIKLRIISLNEYEKLCYKILQKVYVNRRVITYFSSLHDLIKKFEQHPDLSVEIPQIVTSLIKNMLFTTGSVMLPGEIKKDLHSHYSGDLAATWYSGVEQLDWSENRYKSANPTDSLRWLYDMTPEEEKLLEDFVKDCDKYRDVLSAAFYAKRFGAKHPFNVFLNKYITENYPYYSALFKKLLKANFNYWKRTADNSYVQWREQVLEHLGLSAFHYQSLSRCLKQLGKEFPFKSELLEDCDK